MNRRDFLNFISNGALCLKMNQVVHESVREDAGVIAGITFDEMMGSNMRGSIVGTIAR